MKLKDYLKLKEDAAMGTMPVNTTGTGNIAGTTNDPVVPKTFKRKRKRKPAIISRDRGRMNK